VACIQGDCVTVTAAVEASAEVLPVGTASVFAASCIVEIVVDSAASCVGLWVVHETE